MLQKSIDTKNSLKNEQQVKRIFVPEMKNDANHLSPARINGVPIAIW